MKNLKQLSIIILLLISSITYAQKPTVDYLKYKKYTTAQKNAISVTDTTKVYIVFDKDLDKLQIYKNGAWKEITPQAALDLKANITYVDDEVQLAKDYTQIIAGETAALRDSVADVRTDLALKADIEDLEDANNINEAEWKDVLGIVDKANKSNVLEKDNTTAFTPTADYHPSTKKYVDDNSGGEATIALFGKTDIFSVNGGFDGSSNWDRTINYFIPNFQAKYDNTKITSLSFRSAQNYIELARVQWDGNTANAITVLETFPQISISTNTIYTDFDLTSYDIILNKDEWLYVKSAVSGTSNLADPTTVFDFDSSNNFTEINNQVRFELAYSISSSFPDNVKMQEVEDEVSLKADKSNVIEKNSETPYTPTADYHPANLKAVKDNSARVELFGTNGGFVVNGGFDGSSNWDRTINYFIPNFQAKYDNTKITNVSFRAGQNYLEIARVQWDGNTANAITVLETYPQIALTTNTVYQNLDISSSNVILNKDEWLYVKSAVTGTSNLADPTTVFDFDSSYNFTELNNQVRFELAWSVDESYQTTIIKNKDSHILTNIIEEDVLTNSTPLFSLGLDVEQTSEGTRIYKEISAGTDAQFRTQFGTKTFKLTNGKRYALCFKQRYNQDNAIANNGHGFVLNSGTSFSIPTHIGVPTLLRIPVNSSKLWYNLVNIFDFDKNSGDYNLTYRTYTFPSWTTTRMAVDVTIKDVFILELGETSDYFFDTNFEWFKSLLSDKNYFETLVIQDASRKSEINSIYNNGLLMSLGNSMPETRTYQNIVANALGMNYNNDLAGTVDVNGTPTAHLSFVIGGTWCAPVTTINGGAQTIANSAYIRSRFLKYYNPKVVLIQASENDNEHFGTIYGGKNPDGTTPYNYGLNDVAYEGDGVDISNEIYQDANGINIAPSLGASYRGMLKQLVSEMPETKFVIIGMPKTNLNYIGSPTFNQNYYDAAIGKNAVLKKVAEEFGFPYIDLYNGVGNNRYTFDYHVIDDLHFSTFGGKKTADTILSQGF